MPLPCSKKKKKLNRFWVYLSVLVATGIALQLFLQLLYYTHFPLTSVLFVSAYYHDLSYNQTAGPQPLVHAESLANHSYLFFREMLPQACLDFKRYLLFSLSCGSEFYVNMSSCTVLHLLHGCEVSCWDVLRHCCDFLQPLRCTNKGRSMTGVHSLGTTSTGYEFLKLLINMSVCRRQQCKVQYSSGAASEKQDVCFCFFLAPGVVYALMHLNLAT